ncbi:Glutamate--cysteine ligase catalytic subunit [Brachionus plicatilis]|uniref:Glutamate--cysteine ligase n=1 Tax=Brachionus plicatilis TaxID=10195 RepID=A0A3M7T3Q4_BRAPC|nr:Glutamate--cysteine ligase catalytic subunit [Brachionus plicatilis]
MGLLSSGTPLDWTETKKNSWNIRNSGIEQFIRIYKKFKNSCNYPFKWGDEIEFTLVRFDHDQKKVQLLLKAEQLLEKLKDSNIAFFHPEYASYMVESTPIEPFSFDLNTFKYLEDNMDLRRKTIEALLDQNEHVIFLTSFPLLGCDEFTYPSYKPSSNKHISSSIFYPDEIIFNGHPRFRTLSRNIRERKNKNVSIYVPIFKDKNTLSPFVEKLPCPESPECQNLAIEDHVYLDATGFGMGCSCLQATFQAESIEEAKHLYDQLLPLTPILLALSASSPIWRGYLCDIDCRWNVISASVDDRTDEELGHLPLKKDKYRVYKSRYDSVDSFLSEPGQLYNDIELVKDTEFYEKLIKNKVDKILAEHVSHLFIRDPIAIFKEKLTSDDDQDVDSFENIQSTNWQSMRFKPPPIRDNAEKIGWRVEFRPVELQFTSFENSAFCAFVILLTHAIKQFDLNFLIPISKIDENMERAQKRNACLEQKFYFRKNVFEQEDLIAKQKTCELVELSIDEIINGNDEFKGLSEILFDYLCMIENIEAFALCKLKQYIKLISSRANGTLMTPASYMRKFVKDHPKYLHDSVVDNEVNYDLIWHIYLITNRKIEMINSLNVLLVIVIAASLGSSKTIAGKEQDDDYSEESEINSKEQVMDSNSFESDEYIDSEYLDDYLVQLKNEIADGGNQDDDNSIQSNEDYY